MHDRDVRNALLHKLHEKYAEDVDTRIIQEMGVWSGAARVDVAVVNGELCGYELKSERDSLNRLPSQVEIYNKVFDRVTLVVADRHAKKARSIIPRWWGVDLARMANGRVEIINDRASKLNPHRDPNVVVDLLTKIECLEVLDSMGMAKGWRSKTLPDIQRKLVSELALDDLCFAIRMKIKQRILSHGITERVHSM